MSKFVKIVNIVTICLSLVLVVAPLVAGAQFQLPDPGGTGLNAGVTSESTVTGLVFRIINIALALAGLIAVLFLIIGGFRYITSAGNEEATEQAKKMILNAVIGIIVVILSFVVIRVISNTLASNNL